LRVASLPSLPGTAAILFGYDLAQWNGASLPLALGFPFLPSCLLWIGPGPEGTVALAHPGGAAGFTFAIPNNQALADLVVGAQALVLDPAAPSGFASLSNGVILRLD
jgi:hypothetical protein